MSLLRFSLFWMLFCLGLASFVVSARAAEYTLEPSVTVQETYDDNVFLKETDDLEHRASPALSLEARTEKAELKARAAWDISKYERHDELDSVDQRFGLSANLKPSELRQYGFSGGYVDDYTFVSTLEESGLLAERSKRKQFTVDPYATFTLDNRNSLRVSYSFTDTQYELETYNDSRVNGGNVTWYHDLMNERTRLIFSAGASQSEFERTDTDVTQSTYRGLVGLDHRFTENLKLEVMVGPRYTESEFPRGGVTADDNDTGFVVDCTMDWRLEERLTFSVNVNRDIAQSIYGENITRDRARVSFMYRLTERLRGNLSTAYYRSETDGFVRSEKRQTFSARPSMTYRITEYLDLRAGYAYTRTENRLTDYSQERNRVYVQLAIDWPVTFD